MLLLCFCLRLLLLRLAAVALSVISSVGSWEWPRVIKAWCKLTQVLAIINMAASSALADEDTTTLKSLYRTWIDLFLMDSLPKKIYPAPLLCTLGAQR